MMPDRLFHYQPFEEAHLVSLLSTGIVKLSRPDRFNDPWDCRVHYRVPTASDERKQLVMHLAALHRKHDPATSDAERNRRAGEFMSDPGKFEAALTQMEKDFYTVICNRYRVYCLAEKPNSSLMWAHYASSHTGICLEFDTRKVPLTPEFPESGALFKVNYQAVYPAYNFHSGGFEALFTKSEDWSYEAEWRLIAEERGFALSPWTLKTNNDLLMLPSGVLRSVTIGCLTDDSTRQLIQQLVGIHAPSVLLRQATLAPDRYELRINPPF